MPRQKKAKEPEKETTVDIKAGDTTVKTTEPTLKKVLQSGVQQVDETQKKLKKRKEKIEKTNVETRVKRALEKAAVSKDDEGLEDLKETLQLLASEFLNEQTGRHYEHLAHFMARFVMIEMFRNWEKLTEIARVNSDGGAKKEIIPVSTGFSIDFTVPSMVNIAGKFSYSESHVSKDAIEVDLEQPELFGN